MKRILVGFLVVFSMLMGAPAMAPASADNHHPNTTAPACRPAAIHRLGFRLDRQEVAGHERRCHRMERHLAVLQAACDAPAG